MINNSLFSSKETVYETPLNLFSLLNKEFSFDIDVCAIPSNAKCQNFYSPDNDGLKQNWEGNCWMNPPYGRQIKQWMEKAYMTAKKNNGTVVCLVPARTDTKWWHDLAMKATEIRFIQGRLKFGECNNSAPFPSCIVVFKRGDVGNIPIISSLHVKEC